jgi:hypothetical protein
MITGDEPRIGGQPQDNSPGLSTVWQQKRELDLPRIWLDGGTVRTNMHVPDRIGDLYPLPYQPMSIIFTLRFMWIQIADRVPEHVESKLGEIDKKIRSVFREVRVERDREGDMIISRDKYYRCSIEFEIETNRHEFEDWLHSIGTYLHSGPEVYQALSMHFLGYNSPMPIRT